MRFGNECKNELWAFTFLCQFGLYCLNLLLTWGTVLSWSQHGTCCREMRCADIVLGGQVRGLAPSRKKSCLRVCVSRNHARLGKSQAGRRAGSELHYQEYLGERISVNPNRYKDFRVFALSQIYWKTLLLLPFLAFCFWFSFLNPHCLLNLCGFLSFPSIPLSSTAPQLILTLSPS